VAGDCLHHSAASKWLKEMVIGTWLLLTALFYLFLLFAGESRFVSYFYYRHLSELLVACIANLASMS
jgi:hypothetical protein